MLDIDFLKAILFPGRRAPAADETLWDGQACEFADFELPTVENSFTMRVLARYGLPRRSDRVLDVGCGAGRYAVALAKEGAYVHGTDISPNMLKNFDKSVQKYGVENVSFSLEDFHAHGADARHGRFDLVLANMTPAVQSSDDIDKLNAYSTRDVLLVKPTRGTDSVTDGALRELGLCNKPGSKDWIPAAFAYLWALGYSPELHYDRQQWRAERSLGKALSHYVNRVKTMWELDDAQEGTIRDYIHSIAENGMVREVIDTTVVAVYWQVSQQAIGGVIE